MKRELKTSAAGQRSISKKKKKEEQYMRKGGQREGGQKGEGDPKGEEV